MLHEESHGFPSYWLSKDGEAKKCSDHAEYARRHLNVSCSNQDVKKRMMESEWLRIVITSNAVMYQGKHIPSQKQRKWLKDMSIELDKPIINADTMKQLEEVEGK
jgi:hypothetical protein